MPNVSVQDTYGGSSGRPKGGNFGSPGKSVPKKPKPAASTVVPYKPGGQPKPSGSIGQNRLGSGGQQSAPASPAPQQSTPSVNYGGGYSGGSVDVNSLGQYSGVSTPEPVRSIYDMTTAEQDDLIRPDQIYNNEVTAYGNALASLLADLELEKGETERGYKKSLSDLGWLGEGQGYEGWDITNPTTAFANSYTNNENDFAARGMYDSSARAEALARMLSDFGDQRTGLASTQDASLKDISNRRAAGETSRNDSVAMARQNALARYAASLGIV